MPKRTHQPKKRPILRKRGFMSRNSTSTGKRILKRRRDKGRARLTVSNDHTADKNKKFSRLK